jgi:hypothetical protein
MSYLAAVFVTTVFVIPLFFASILAVAAVAIAAHVPAVVLVISSADAVETSISVVVVIVVTPVFAPVGFAPSLRVRTAAGTINIARTGGSNGRNQ